MTEAPPADLRCPARNSTQHQSHTNFKRKGRRPLGRRTGPPPVRTGPREEERALRTTPGHRDRYRMRRHLGGESAAASIGAPGRRRGPPKPISIELPKGNPGDGPAQDSQSGHPCTTTSQSRRVANRHVYRRHSEGFSSRYSTINDARKYVRPIVTITAALVFSSGPAASRSLLLSYT